MGEQLRATWHSDLAAQIEWRVQAFLVLELSRQTWAWRKPHYSLDGKDGSNLEPLARHLSAASLEVDIQ